MALGGGSFITQNKKLPGAYINFISAANASATLSERGICTMPLELDWGVEDKVFEVTAGDFQKHSMKYFGYAYTAPELKGLRDLFLNAQKLFAYRVNGGGGKAENAFATALHSGTVGNNLRIVIQPNVDNESAFNVSTYMNTTLLDTQIVTSATELTANDYVSFKPSASLELTASTPLSGGTNGTADGASYQAYADAIESYRFNTMGVVTSTATVKGLFKAFCKRLRDEMGVKFQLVLHDYASADYMGVISVKNTVSDTDAHTASLIYWVTGAEAGCAINRSLQNRTYDGEFSPVADYTQSALETALEHGELVFHAVGDDINVLEDINTKTTVSDTEGDVFKDNQTIRVIDQIANDVAVLFNTKYLGAVPNDASGRTSLWSDIVKHHKQLETIRAIEDFSDSDVVVTQGDTKKAVNVADAITVVNAMSKLYMTVTVA